MSRICLFEEYIYNLFLHFNRVCDDNCKIRLPIFFQTKRTNLNIWSSDEVVLLNTHRLEFRRLGKGEQLGIPDSSENLDNWDRVEQFWTTKVEFILALKQFYKTNQFPTKEIGENSELQQLVSKRVSNLCQTFKPRKTKLKEFEELKIDSDDPSDLPPIEKRKTKFKIFVEKAFLANVPTPQTPKKKSGFIKGFRKLTNVKKLIDTHNKHHTLANHYRLSKTQFSQKLLENLSLNIYSLNKHKENFSIEKSIKLGKLLMERREQTMLQKKEVIETYLRNAYVTNTKLF